MIIRVAGCLVLLLIATLGMVLARNYVRDHPQDVPWTDLKLDDPIGLFTGRKLAALHSDARYCSALLSAAGGKAQSAPARIEGEKCGYENGFRLASEEIVFEPDAPVTSCPVAAALLVFERQILQPAAIKHFGQPVVRISHVGSYSCRRLYNRATGAFSEHATANALDVIGFGLEDGRRISVLRDWNRAGPESRFLKEVRDGACTLFATVLSPDYNAAHADHLHLDQADRGAGGWRMCR